MTKVAIAIQHTCPPARSEGKKVRFGSLDESLTDAKVSHGSDGEVLKDDPKGERERVIDQSRR